MRVACTPLSRSNGYPPRGFSPRRRYPGVTTSISPRAGVRDVARSVWLTRAPNMYRAKARILGGGVRRISARLHLGSRDSRGKRETRLGNFDVREKSDEAVAARCANERAIEMRDAPGYTWIHLDYTSARPCALEVVRRLARQVLTSLRLLSREMREGREVARSAGLLWALASFSHRSARPPPTLADTPHR